MAHKHGGGGRGSGGGGGGGCLHAWEEVNFIHKQSGKAAGGGAGVYSQAPNLDWHAEFRNAGFRFSQLMYQGQTLVVHKLTESKFGSKIRHPNQIRSIPGVYTEPFGKLTFYDGRFCAEVSRRGERFTGRSIVR